MTRVRRTVIVTALLTFGGVSTASADLQDDRTRIASAWQTAGGTLLTSGTRYLFDDESAMFTLPETSAPCVRVALVGARGTSLRARFADGETDDSRGRSSSHAGALQLERCGAPATRVVVTNESGRGAVELVAVAYSGNLPTVGALLPERSANEPRTAELPLAVNLATPERRVVAAQVAAFRDGAVEVGEEHVTAGQGAGQLGFVLGPGCHRITVVATRLGKLDPSRIDLDAELRDEEGSLLARDRSDAPDARLEPCTVAEKKVTLTFVGAPEGSFVLAETARFSPYPELPTAFGDDARLRMDRALRKRGAKLVGKPVMLAQGAEGHSRMVLETDRSSCYLVVAAASHGQPRGIALRAQIGANEAEDERGPSDDSGVVAFCARGERLARVDLEARPTGARWGLAVYRVAGPSNEGR